MTTLVTALTLIAPLSAQSAPQVIVITSESGVPAANMAVAVQVKGAKATAAPGTIADMGQKNKAFTPHMLLIQTGTLVNFPNFDTVRHHVYSFSPTRTFEIKLYAGTPAAPVMFDKPGTATLGCNIHDRMLGYIHVVDTPHFGITDAKGSVTIDLPPGEHKLRVWSPDSGENSMGSEHPIKTGESTVVIKTKV
jgi:plastocyanin